MRGLMVAQPRLRDEEPDSLERFVDQRIVIISLEDTVSRAGISATMTELRNQPAVELVGTVLYTVDAETPMVMTDELVVKFRAGVPTARIQQLYGEHQVTVVRTSDRRGRVVLRIDATSGQNALDVSNALYETDLVEFAHPNFIVRTERRRQINQPFTPNDSLFADQWHLDNTGQGGGTVDADVDAPEAWAFAQGNAAVVIAVLDDAIQWNHPDLNPNVVPGRRDFTANPPDNDPSPGPGENHGTAVAGVAAARGNNSIGVSGSCPQCGLLPIRMLGGSVADHADAFDYAAAQGASIITNSWGYSIGTPTTDDVVDAITDAAATGRNGLGAVILFAMTNSNVDNCVGAAPDISSHDSVIAVSRSTNEDLLGNGGFGDCMELISPTRGGTLGITTTDRTGGNGYVNGDYYDNFSGTSSATPLVAGIAGLILDINPNLTRMHVQRILEETADKIDAANAAYDANGFSSTHGNGRVNAHRAVVPTVKISVSPARVRKNEPFNVTVTGTAPHGLETVWWFGQNTGIANIDQAHLQSAGGDPVFTHTWTGVRIGERGTYTLGSNARDVLYPNPGDGYPHQASEGGGIDETTVVIVPDLSVIGLLLLALSSIAVAHIRRNRVYGGP
jgi:subtilisin family serine protease